MANQLFELYHYLGAQLPTVVKSVNATYTGTTPGVLWTPSAATRKFQVLGWDFSCFVSVVLAGTQAAGDYVIVYDDVVTAPIAILGVAPAATLAAGSIFGTSAVGSTTFTTAATEWTTSGDLPASKRKDIPLGYTAVAAGTSLKFALATAASGAVKDVGSGVIRVVGTVFGNEA